MEQTISEQILSNHSVDNLIAYSGDRIDVKPSTVLSNEMLPMISIAKFFQTGAKSVNAEIAKNMLVILDHGGFGVTDKYIDIHELARKFSRDNNIRIMDAGTGISHVVFPELGYAQPGYLILGTDSHTVNHGAFNAYAQGIGASDLVELMVKGYTWLTVPETNLIKVDGKLPANVYSKDLILTVNGEKKMDWSTDRAIEWQGTTINDLSMEARMTISNMAVEQGAVAGIMPYDHKVESYVDSTPRKNQSQPIIADKNAQYSEIFEFDASVLTPVVALPHSPDHVKPISELGDIELDQIFLGSCTNSRIEDLAIIAKILKNNEVKVRTLIIPGSASVGLEAVKRGYVEIFMKAGAIWSYSTCGACFGGTLGRVGPGMTALSTSNRNFIGRMGGDETSKVYLGSPATAALSAITGIITTPGAA